MWNAKLFHIHLPSHYLTFHHLSTSPCRSHQHHPTSSQPLCTATTRHNQSRHHTTQHTTLYDTSRMTTTTQHNITQQEQNDHDATRSRQGARVSLTLLLSLSHFFFSPSPTSSLLPFLLSLSSPLSLLPLPIFQFSFIQLFNLYYYQKDVIVKYYI